jgi:hypothetical protein
MATKFIQKRPPKETSKKVNRNFIKEQLKKLEKRTPLQLVFLFAAFIFSVIARLADLITIFPNWTKKTWDVFFIALSFLVIVYALGYMRLAKKRLSDLEVSKNETVNANKLIKRAVEASPTDYKVISSEITLDITPDGDVNYKRLMRLECGVSKIPWAVFHVGVIDGDHITQTDMNITVVNPEDDGSLAFSIIEDNPSSKEIAVLLDPPLTKDCAAGFCATMLVKKAYLDLISKIPDQGKLSIENETDKIVLTFIAPLNYEFQAIRFKSKNLGNTTISKQLDERSVLTWCSEKIPLGDYFYTLIVK